MHEIRTSTSTGDETSRFLDVMHRSVTERRALVQSQI